MSRVKKRKKKTTLRKIIIVACIIIIIIVFIAYIKTLSKKDIDNTENSENEFIYIIHQLQIM